MAIAATHMHGLRFCYCWWRRCCYYCQNKQEQATEERRTTGEKRKHADQGGVEPPQKAGQGPWGFVQSYATLKRQLVLLHLQGPNMPWRCETANYHVVVALCGPQDAWHHALLLLLMLLSSLLNVFLLLMLYVPIAIVSFAVAVVITIAIVSNAFVAVVTAIDSWYSCCCCWCFRLFLFLEFPQNTSTSCFPSNKLPKSVFLSRPRPDCVGRSNPQSPSGMVGGWWLVLVVGRRFLWI